MDAQFQFGIDFRRQRIDAGPFGEVRNDEVVGRHGEGQHEACQETGPQFRQDDAAECDERRRAQVAGGIITAAVQRQELGHDAQDDVRQVEDDVGHEDGPIAQAQAHA